MIALPIDFMQSAVHLGSVRSILQVHFQCDAVLAHDVADDPGGLPSFCVRLSGHQGLSQARLAVKPRDPRLLII